MQIITFLSTFSFLISVQTPVNKIHLILVLTFLIPSFNEKSFFFNKKRFIIETKVVLFT